MSAIADYRPFANLEAKNAIQERFEVPALVSLLGLPRGARLLEVGCGRGVALAPLARLCQPARLVGLDLDPDLLAEARARVGPAAELVHGDVRDLPFDDGEFDVVIDFGTAYHVGRPELALREIARVLRPGGLFVHELRPAQLIAHPVRALGRRLPWDEAPALRPSRRRVLWGARVNAPPEQRGGRADDDRR